MKKFFCLLLAAIIGLTGCGENTADVLAEIPQKGTEQLKSFYFPAEDAAHEGTWLTWPHQYTYGMDYREEVEPIWVQMVSALHGGDNIHIIAYNKTEQQRIKALLEQNDIDMGKVDFLIAKSDDVWVRDTGPMFVYDETDTLTIADFAFDGWGKKTKYKNDDKLPKIAAAAMGVPIIEIPELVLEGGAVELDGAGTLMAAKSSVISKNRNQSLTVAEAEDYLRKYLGIKNFIWLEGVTDQDITDAHIDGMARFYDSKTILTVSEDDFFELYENIPENDYETLINARNARGETYGIIEFPMTSYNVVGLDYKGSYLNYYIGNDVVIVPVCGDVNDAAALKILGGLYGQREIIPIDVTALYQYGGMLHCITQQQPVS